MVELIDLICKSCSNFKSIICKLRIIESDPKLLSTWPMLTFWHVLTSKIIRGCIQWADMQMVFKFQVSRIKIDNFRNVAQVDVLACWPILTSKLVGGWIQWPDMQILFKFQVNRMEINNFRNLAYIGLKNNVWLNSMTWFVNPFQISSQSDKNWGF